VAEPGSWRILVTDTAARYLQRQTADVQRRVRERLLELQAGPHGRAKPLHGRPQWSLRVGGMRLLLQVAEQARVVTVVGVGPRGDVYKDR
jgi:mRNA-degrading endonuclease RelE of RelBE toxin-antitoxin system